MSTIVNARDVLLQAAGTRLDTVALPGNVSVPWPNVTGATKPADYADVTTSILTNSGTSIVMNNANLFKSNSGSGGVFIGSGGLFGKDSGGTETFAIDASTGATRFSGNITGGANINITGDARFDGAYPGALANAAVYSNGSNNAVVGVFAQSSATLGTHAATGIGIHGYGSGAEASGVLGTSANKNGVTGGSFGASGVGVVAYNTAGGVALECVTKFKWGSYTIVAPAGGSNVLREDGTWGTAGTATYAATAGEVSISSQANVTSVTGNAVLRALNGYGQAAMQTDANFVTYRGGSPTGSSDGGFPSDIRLKVGVTPTAGGLSVLKQWEVIDYFWKPGTPYREISSHRLTGFSAQQIQAVTPRLVTVNRGIDGDGDETLLLNKMEMIPDIVKAVQELLARVEALEAIP